MSHTKSMTVEIKALVHFYPTVKETLLGVSFRNYAAANSIAGVKSTTNFSQVFALMVLPVFLGGQPESLRMPSRLRHPSRNLDTPVLDRGLGDRAIARAPLPLTLILARGGFL